MLGVAVHQDNKKLFHACILFIESLINKRQTLPEISIVKLHKLTKIPIHNPQSVYHQILMLLIYQISAQQYHIKIVIKTMKVLMKIGKDRKIEGETKIFYYIELLCKKTALHCL